MLPKDFFSRDTITVAKDLLGKRIIINGCSGIIVETEAYKDDEASHAHKRTDRSELMYSTHGHVYVYLIYGMYHCLNFTSDVEAGAVLIRAIEPTTGIDMMKKRRGIDNIQNLCSGPGKLCQAFSITKKENGTVVNDLVVLEKGIEVSDIVESPRIGIVKAADLHWRFYIKDNKFISKK